MGLLILLLGGVLSSFSYAGTVLIVGDSHSVGTFGKTFHEQLRQKTIQPVELRASCGSIIRWWYTGQETPCGYLEISPEGTQRSLKRARTPLIPALFDSVKPSTVIVALGSNYLRGYPDATLFDDVRRLLLDIQRIGARCIWIGPPTMAKFRAELPEFMHRLEALLHSSCILIDSRPFTRYPEGARDGIHFDWEELKPIAREWAREVGSRAASALR